DPTALGVEASFTFRLRVCVGVQGDAEPVEVGADGRAHGRRVLADAAGEDDGVCPAELEQVRAQVVPHAGDVHLQGQLRARVVLGGSLLDVAQVIAGAAQPQEARAVGQV